MVPSEHMYDLADQLATGLIGPAAPVIRNYELVKELHNIVRVAGFGGAKIKTPTFKEFSPAANYLLEVWGGTSEERANKSLNRWVAKRRQAAKDRKEGLK